MIGITAGIGVGTAFGMSWRARNKGAATTGAGSVAGGGAGVTAAGAGAEMRAVRSRLGDESGLAERILVPYPVESALSGIMRHEERMWYRRTFTVPAKWSGKNRVLVYGDAGHGVPAVEDARTRILLVDDDRGLRELLRATFEGADVEISEARDADGAARSIVRARPDVIVLDIEMPGIDGLTLCRSLKAEPSTRGIGVVLLTGSAPEDAEERARAAGADAFLRKPFSPLDLLGVVEAVAGGRAATRRQGRNDETQKEQLMHYADDLRRVVEELRARSGYVESTKRTRRPRHEDTPQRRQHREAMQHGDLRLGSPVRRLNSTFRSLR